MLLLLGFKMITRKKWIQEYAKDGNTEPEKDKIELRWWSLLSFSRKTPTKYDAHFLFGDCSVHTTFIRDTPWESRQESVSLWGPCLESVCCTISCSNSCCFFPVVSWNLTFIFWAFFCIYNQIICSNDWHKRYNSFPVNNSVSGSNTVCLRVI